MPITPRRVKQMKDGIVSSKLEVDLTGPRFPEGAYVEGFLNILLEYHASLNVRKGEEFLDDILEILGVKDVQIKALELSKKNSEAEIIEIHRSQAVIDLAETKARREGRGNGNPNA